MNLVRFAAIFFPVVALGCQDRVFVNMGPGPDGRDYAIASESIRKYAQQHAISRDEALERIRREQRQLAEQKESALPSGTADAAARAPDDASPNADNP